MAKQNKDYGYDIQKLYLEMMLANAETFVRCQSIFDFSLFDRKLQETAQFINKYVTEYNNLPTYEMVNKSCNIDLKQTEQLTEEHFDWLLNDFETYFQTPQMNALDRMKLFKLAWDVVGSEFAGRQLQYEKFYAGASFIIRNHNFIFTSNKSSFSNRCIMAIK